MVSDLQEAFAQRFGILGERFDSSEIREPIDLLFEVPQYYIDTALESARTQAGKPYPFLLQFVTNPTFNAAACDDTRGGLISINASVPILLFLACIKFASRCDLTVGMPKYLNNKLLVYDEKLDLQGRIVGNDLSHETIAQLILDTESSLFVKDEIERNQVLQYGLFLYDISIRFVVMHECMHLILGHAKYVEAQFGLNYFVEFASEREELLEPSLGQALEFLSDRNTARGILVQSLLGNTLHPFGKHLPSDITIKKDAFITRSVVLAFCLLMHMFPYRLDGDLEETIVRSHPHPYVRMQWICTELGAEVGKERYDDLIVRPFANAMGTLTTNFVTPNSWMAVNQEENIKEWTFSYLSYDSVKQSASNLQKTMWKLAPVYQQ